MSKLPCPPYFLWNSKGQSMAQTSKPIKREILPFNPVYLSIVDSIRLNHKLPDIGISKQARNKYIRILKVEGVIFKIGYSVWEVSMPKFMEFVQNRSKPTSEKEVNFSSMVAHQGVMPTNLIRGHGYVFSVAFPKEIRVWENLLKRSGQSYTALPNGVFRSIVLHNKVWFCADSIVIYYPKHKSFYGDTAQESENEAIYHLRRVISLLEHRLRLSLRIGKEYRFTVDKAHYAEIENDLARQLNRDKEKLHVVGQDGKTWLIADFSDSVNELETVHAQKSKEDMQQVVAPYMNDLREYFVRTGELPTMSKVLNMIEQLTMINKNVMLNQAQYAENMKSHITAIQQLAHGVQLLNAREERFKAAQLKKEQKKINEYGE